MLKVQGQMSTFQAISSEWVGLLIEISGGIRSGIVVVDNLLWPPERQVSSR